MVIAGVGVPHCTQQLSSCFSCPLKPSHFGLARARSSSVPDPWLAAGWLYAEKPKKGSLPGGPLKRHRTWSFLSSLLLCRAQPDSPGSRHGSGKQIIAPGSCKIAVGPSDTSTEENPVPEDCVSVVAMFEAQDSQLFWLASASPRNPRSLVCLPARRNRLHAKVRDNRPLHSERLPRCCVHDVDHALPPKPR